jgi:hypothetical protein
MIKIGEIGLQEVADMMSEGVLTLKIFSFDDEVEGRLSNVEGEEFGVLDAELLEKFVEKLLESRKTPREKEKHDKKQMGPRSDSYNC